MKDFILPDIGEGIVECEIVKWLVEEGDIVAEDQNIVEVMTDKAVVEIPAKDSGTIGRLYYKTGEVAQVHQPLFAMDIPQQEDKKELKIQQDMQQHMSSSKEDGIATHNAVTEDFILPDIGEGIVECEIVEWKVEEGEMISEDQTVVEVMTDKAVVEIPAKHSGKIAKLYYSKGDIAAVHAPLFALERALEGQASIKSEQSNNASNYIEEKPVKQLDSQSGKISNSVTRNGKALASPAVRRIAREMNVILSEVPGTGKKGRVLKEDVERFVQTPNTTMDDGKGSRTDSSINNDRVEPIRGVKAAMAKQMQDSVSTIPHFTVSDEIEMDNLIAVRQQLKPVFEQSGTKLSYMPFFIKALSLALQAFPVINSRVNEDCTELTYLSSHNVGMAVDSKIGLIVPNIKDVQNLSLLEVAQHADRLISLAREGKLTTSDLNNGTISISNIGVIGGTVATPVINKPEVAIVALGKIQTLPRFDDNGEVKATNLMQVSWSGDHRVIDGATMVKFSNLWKSYLENPVLMLKELR